MQSPTKLPCKGRSINMESVTILTNYYANPGGFNTPDFTTELTINDDGSFKTSSPYNEKSTVRSWLYEIYPNGTSGLTIVVNSNIAQFYDKMGPEVEEIRVFLEKNLKNIQTTNSDFRWTPGV